MDQGIAHRACAAQRTLSERYDGCGMGDHWPLNPPPRPGGREADMRKVMNAVREALRVSLYRIGWSSHDHLLRRFNGPNVKSLPGPVWTGGPAQASRRWREIK